MALPRFGIFIFRNQDAYLGNLSLDLRVLFSNRHENASTTEHLFTDVDTNVGLGPPRNVLPFS